MPVDYEKEYRKQFRLNRREVSRDIESGDLKLKKKIANFCELHGFLEDDVISAILENEMLAAKFAKDPKKRNIYEKVAAREIREIAGVENFLNLPSRAKYLLNGAVVGKKPEGASTNVKTVDFEWDYNDYRFYASHKYTKDSGGAQDSAYKDIQSFIEEANKTTYSKTFFLAIADGLYYRGTDQQTNTTRMQRLKDLANRRMVFACDIHELPQLMSQLAK